MVLLRSAVSNDVNDNDAHRSIVRRTLVPPSMSRPIVTPLMPSVAYSSGSPDMLDDQYEGRVDGYTYAREGHPNADVLASKIDWLEGAMHGMITSSGMAALSAVVLGCLNSGDHVVAGDQLYGRVFRMLSREAPRFGIATSFVDATSAQAVEAAITDDTKMVIVETVTNPTLQVADLEGIATLCKQKGIKFVVDNTFTTPRAVRPFQLGADIVFQSVTKLLAGHSDVTLGYVAAKDETDQTAIHDTITTWGLRASPFDCWLAERGLHSFNVRFDKAAANAIELAEYLSFVEGVEDVIFPGLDTHAQHTRASRLFGGVYGNIVSFRIKPTREAANTFIKAAHHIAFAPTLGDIGTTISHAATSSHRGLTPEAREALGLTEGFFRLSVGIEEVELLKSELEGAILKTL
jgi:cystathionine gamma-synthase